MHRKVTNSKKVSEPSIDNALRKRGVEEGAKPFLKWAGGKAQLVNTLVTFFPPEIESGRIKKYAEPFVGGGALFFLIAQGEFGIKQFYISDINYELILAYKTIKENVKELISELKALENEFYSKDKSLQKEFFLKQRRKFNEALSSIDYDKFSYEWVLRTAEIIFLNRTCFNGLFRVNSKGEFNVPFGDYKNPKICDEKNLRAVSAILQSTIIECGDFTTSEKFIDKETFVYFDPPYRPISKTASFTSYSKKDFGEKEQVKLADYFRSMDLIGAKLMLSNSDPKNEKPEDNYFDNLYKHEDGKFFIQRVDASRNINSIGAKRGKIKELVITNYPTPSPV
jgi:DNA adenine methylase